MKFKPYLFLVLLVAVIAVCAASGQRAAGLPDWTPLEELPADYSYEDAEADGCLILENGLSVMSGQETWDAFLAAVEEGKNASIRIVDYRVLDPERYAPELYESIKDEYPQLWIKDFSYDGEQYTLRWYSEGELVVRQRPYLIRLEGVPVWPNATYSYYVRYVLVDDPDVTWEELEQGSVGTIERIPYNTIYTELTWK